MPRHIVMKRDQGSSSSQPEMNYFTLEEWNAILWEKLLSKYIRYFLLLMQSRALEIAALSSGKGLILIIVSYLKKLSLEWGMLCSKIVFLTSEDQLSSILEIVLAPRNIRCLCSHVICWDQKYLPVRKVRYKHHSLGNSAAVCQDDSKHSAGGTGKSKYSQTAKTLLHLLPLNCFCQPLCSLSLSTGSDQGDNSNMSSVPSLTWPPALSTKVLYGATQSH